MSALDRIVEKNPLPVGVTGMLGSLVTSIADHMEGLSTAVVFLSQLVGLGVACLTFCLLFRRWRKRERDEDDDLP